VQRAKRVLAQYFRKSAPDLVINAALRDAWLDFSDDHSGS
jgi:hypothetical protein